MRERLSNNTRVNMNTATQAELEAIVVSAEARAKAAEADRFIAQDYLHRRFGGEAVAKVVSIRDFRAGRSAEEYDLDVMTDDFDGGDAA